MENTKDLAPGISVPTRNKVVHPSLFEPYIPVDPKYLYFPSRIPNGRYNWNSTIDTADAGQAEDGLGQLMFQKYLIADDDEETVGGDREGGIGSTTKS